MRKQPEIKAKDKRYKIFSSLHDEILQCEKRKIKVVNQTTTKTVVGRKDSLPERFEDSVYLDLLF